MAKIAKKLPIKHWSHSSLLSFLRNPLAWHKRYVELVYDMPSSPAGIIGRAAHKATEHYYSLPADGRGQGGGDKAWAIAMGLEYLRNVSDFEINFGKRVTSKRAKAQKRQSMERDYLQAINFYLEKPPRHEVLGIEVSALAKVEGLPLPIKAVSDLVVVSKIDRKGVDVIDHKFVAAFSPKGSDKTLFVLQAIFNYYTVKKTFGRPVRRFIVYECKITRNKDGGSQVRRYVIDFRAFREEFIIFHRLLRDATKALLHTKIFLPNPSDIFEGENSFDIYRINLPREEFDAHFKPDE